MARVTGLPPWSAKRIPRQPITLSLTTQKNTLTQVIEKSGRIVVKARKPKLPTSKKLRVKILKTPGQHISVDPTTGVTAAVAPINANIAPITQQQVATWDATLRCLGFVAPLEWQAANALTGGTAFYTRDLLLIAAYGHLISWPGWGPFFNGPQTAPYPGKEPGKGYIPPVPLGSPQPTNILTALSFELYQGETIIVRATTCRPATPVLIVTGQFIGAAPAPTPKNLQRITVPTKRDGQVVPHGQLAWYNCLYEEFTLDTTDGYNFTASIPTDRRGPIYDRDCWLAEYGAQPVVHWTSQAHPFPWARD